MNIWRMLGLEPTRDVTAIRRAYAAAAKQFHPEEQPEEFKRVRTAYEQALAYARTAPRESTISGSYTTAPPKKYNAKGNKANPKKGVGAGGSYAGPSRRPDRPSSAGLGGPGGRRPRAEARIEPLPGARRVEEPDWLREETADGQAELFRRAPAMAAFQELWRQEKKRGDKKTWQEFFSSPVFLAVQREEGFTAALRDFVEKEVKDGRQLPQKFLLELSLAYGIRYRSGGPYYLSYAAFPGIEAVKEILLLGHPLDRLTHEEDKIWAACWRDYFELNSLAKNGGFENPDRARRWKELFDRYRKDKITERPEVTRKEEADVEYRHPYGLRLLAFFVQQSPLPAEVIQYLYDSLQLEVMGKTSFKRHYKPLLDAVLPVLPDQGPVKAEKEALAAVKTAVENFLKRYDRRTPFAHTSALRSYDTAATPEEMQAAWEVLETPQFRQLLLTRRLKESGIFDKILGAPTALIPALTAQVTNRQEEASAREILARCLETTHKWSHDPEYFFDIPYPFFGACPEKISLENREFWYYWLATAFPAAFSTENEEFIGKRITWDYHPSMWWRWAFTGFDEAARRITAPRSRTFPLGEHSLTVEFHLFYQKIAVDGEECGEKFPWAEFLALAGEDDQLFWLALPLAMGRDEERRAIRREILSRMPAIHIDNTNSGALADCLVNHITTSRKETAAARGYGEDGHILYGYEVRQNRTLEVYKAMGILRRREKLWDRPFATVEAAVKAGEAYLETLLDPPEQLVERRSVAGMTPRQKAKALVECLGKGEYTGEDRKRDETYQLSATEDFLGYGVKRHGSYTADFYRENFHRPCRAAVRFGTQPGERFRLKLTLEIWPFGSEKAKKGNRAELLTRMGMLGEACYLVGTIELGKDSYTLISSSGRRMLYAVREGDTRNYMGKDLASLAETLLYPSEWDAVEAVESYRTGGPDPKKTGGQ